MPMKNEPSELLKLLDQRYKEQGLEHGTYKPPLIAVDYYQRAARLHALAHQSDPFAYGRMCLHLRRGLDTVSDVEAAARSVLAARGHR